MSDFGYTRSVINGQGDFNEAAVYTVGETQRLRLEVITFSVTTTNALTARFPFVEYLAKDGTQLGFFAGRRTIPPNTVVTCTFMIEGASTTGAAGPFDFTTDPLPDTVLEPGSVIGCGDKEASTGTIVSGDVIGDVVLYGIADSTDPAPDVVPLLTPITLSEQVA